MVDEDADLATVGQKMIKLTEGACRSKTIFYLAQCSICEKSYTGRTVDPLQKRFNGIDISIGDPEESRTWKPPRHTE